VGILAYLDPGSGGLFIQILAGGLAGVATLFVMLRRRLSSVFRGRRADRRTSVDQIVPSEDDA